MKVGIEGQQGKEKGEYQLDFINYEGSIIRIDKMGLPSAD